MRRLLAVTVILTFAAMPAGLAQHREGKVLLSGYLGLATRTSLWSIDRQPLSSLFAASRSQPSDTVHLSRSIGPGVTTGAGIAYNLGTLLTLRGDLFYSAMPVESACQAVYLDPQSSDNASWCQDTDGQSIANTSYGFSGSIAARLVPHATLRPYVRVGAGAVHYGESTVAVEGTLLRPSPVRDPSPKHTSVALVIAGGVGRSAGAGREILLEVRDVLTSLDRVVGTPDSAGTALIRSHIYNRFMVSVGMDFDLLTQIRGSDRR